MSKPRMFIGSSVEALPIAEALHRNLQHGLEVTVWRHGIFRPSAGTIDSLLFTLDDQDFGVFVFRPDDIVTLRGEELQAVRDNVLIEFGIFIGRLGRERVFFLLPDNAGDLRLPTDLLGIQPVRYESNRSDGNLMAATGPAGNEIVETAQRLGKRPRLQPAEAGDPAVATKKTVRCEFGDDLRLQQHR